MAKPKTKLPEQAVEKMIRNLQVGIAKIESGKEGYTAHNTQNEDPNLQALGKYQFVPKYWWKEFDTYKVGVTQNSSSTMHTITRKALTEDDFSYLEGMDKQDERINERLNLLIEEYKNTDEEELKRYYKQRIIEKLPDSFIYKRFVTLNYEVLINIVKDRNNHFLKEWHDFISWVYDLPHSDLILKGANYNG